MKPDYVCPICSDTFKRKWNLIRHAKDLHSIVAETDKRFKIKSRSRPSSTIQKDLSNHLAKEAQFSISSTIRKLAKTINDIHRLEGLAQGQPVQDPYSSLNEDRLDHILDNFVLVPKHEIQGISAHFCKECLTFQYTYVKQIGTDQIAQEKHSCSAINLVTALQNKDDRQKFLRREAVQSLMAMTKTMFPSNLSIKCEYLSPAYVEERGDPPTLGLVDFHSPLFIINDFALYTEGTFGALIRDAINRTHFTIDDAMLKVCLRNSMGTFFVVFSNDPSFPGNYLISISNQ